MSRTTFWLWIKTRLRQMISDILAGEINCETEPQHPPTKPCSVSMAAA